MTDAFGLLLERLRSEPGFCWLKLNHGTWERLDRIRAHGARDDDFHGPAGDVMMLELADMIASAKATVDEHLVIAVSNQAFPGDREHGFLLPEVSAARGANDGQGPGLAALAADAAVGDRRLRDGLLLKRAVQQGRWSALVETLRPHRVLTVGPDVTEQFLTHFGLQGSHLLVTRSEIARRHELLEEIARAAEGHDVVLLQLGPMATWMVLQLRHRHPAVRWIDCGLTLSLADPESDLLDRPWGIVHREAIVDAWRHPTGATTAELVPDAAPAPIPDLARALGLKEGLTVSLHRTAEEAGDTLERLLGGAGSVRWASSPLGRAGDLGGRTIHHWLDVDDAGVTTFDGVVDCEAVLVRNPFEDLENLGRLRRGARELGLTPVLVRSNGAGPRAVNWPWQLIRLDAATWCGSGDLTAVVTPSGRRPDRVEQHVDDAVSTMIRAVADDRAARLGFAMARRMASLAERVGWVAMRQPHRNPVTHLAVAPREGSVRVDSADVAPFLFRLPAPDPSLGQSVAVWRRHLLVRCTPEMAAHSDDELCDALEASRSG